jgi:hypothetical protein
LGYASKGPAIGRILRKECLHSNWLNVLVGQAFGNAAEWIHAAIKRAVQKVQGFDLDGRLVSYGQPSAEVQEPVKGLA